MRKKVRIYSLEGTKMVHAEGPSAEPHMVLTFKFLILLTASRPLTTAAFVG